MGRRTGWVSERANAGGNGRNVELGVLGGQVGDGHVEAGFAHRLAVRSALESHAGSADPGPGYEATQAYLELAHPLVQAVNLSHRPRAFRSEFRIGAFCAVRLFHPSSAPVGPRPERGRTSSLWTRSSRNLSTSLRRSISRRIERWSCTPRCQVAVEGRSVSRSMTTRAASSSLTRFLKPSSSRSEMQ